MLMSSRWWWSFLSIPVAESLAELKGKEFILQISWFKPKIKTNCRYILTWKCFVWKQCEIPQPLTASRGLSANSSQEECPWGMAEEWPFLWHLQGFRLLRDTHWGFPNKVMFCVDLPLLSQAWDLFIWRGCWQDVLKGDVWNTWHCKAVLLCLWSEGIS